MQRIIAALDDHLSQLSKSERGRTDQVRDTDGALEDTFEEQQGETGRDLAAWLTPREKKRRMTVYLPESVINRLAEVANEVNRSGSELIERALRATFGPREDE